MVKLVMGRGVEFFLCLVGMTSVGDRFLGWYMG